LDGYGVTPRTRPYSLIPGSTHCIAGRFHVPLNFDIYIKRKDCTDKKLFKAKVEIARELVEKAVGYGFTIDVVFFDSYC
jgi:SRSO17 transposase